MLGFFLPSLVPFTDVLITNTWPLYRSVIPRYLHVGRALKTFYPCYLPAFAYTHSNRELVLQAGFRGPAGARAARHVGTGSSHALARAHVPTSPYARAARPTVDTATRFPVQVGTVTSS